MEGIGEMAIECEKRQGGKEVQMRRGGGNRKGSDLI